MYKRFLAFVLLSSTISACVSGGMPTPIYVTATSAHVTATSADVVTSEIKTPTSDFSGIFFGAYGADAKFEKELDQKFSVQLYYNDWTTQFAGSPAELYASRNQILLYTWEYRPPLNGPDDPYILQPLKAILDGKYDPYIQEFAAQARTFRKPVFLRFGHEMNGDWYPWGGTRNGGATTKGYGDTQKADGPEMFVDTYRYIHAQFEQAGAQNVLWVWCPNILMEGNLGADWNEIGNYYPGDEFVDWLCMDGYNWGTSQDWSHWQSFDEIFSATYQRLLEINPNKPIMIGETASSPEGGDKAAWADDTLQKVRLEYPQIKVFVWFHINKETDWRMNSTPEVFEAIKTQLAQPGWEDDFPGFEK